MFLLANDLTILPLGFLLGYGSGWMERDDAKKEASSVRTSLLSSDVPLRKRR